MTTDRQPGTLTDIRIPGKRHLRNDEPRPPLLVRRSLPPAESGQCLQSSSPAVLQSSGWGTCAVRLGTMNAATGPKERAASPPLLHRDDIISCPLPNFAKQTAMSRVSVFLFRHFSFFGVVYRSLPFAHFCASSVPSLPPLVYEDEKVAHGCGGGGCEDPVAGEDAQT